MKSHSRIKTYSKVHLEFAEAKVPLVNEEANIQCYSIIGVCKAYQETLMRQLDMG